MSQLPEGFVETNRIIYEERDIRRSTKRFLKEVHGITLLNTPKKRYKALVNDGVRAFQQYHKEREKKHGF